MAAMPWFAAVGVQSSITSYTLSTSTTQILGPNPARIALTFQCPGALTAVAGMPVSVCQRAQQLTPTTTNTYSLSYTCPSNTAACITSYSATTTSGSAPTFQLYYTHAGYNMKLTGAFSQGNLILGPVWINPGDTAGIYCSAGTSGTVDLFMSVVAYASANEALSQGAYVGFNSGIANGTSLAVPSGNNPLTLDYQTIGGPLWGAVWGYGSGSSVPLTVIETYLTTGLSKASALQLAASLP